MSISLKDDVLNAVRDSKINRTCRCKTPKFRKPTSPPKFKPPMQTNANYTPPASVKKPCMYKTPCGWCTKWDKKCDKKIGELTKDHYLGELKHNALKTDCNHDWVCEGVSPGGASYICKKCYAHELRPFSSSSHYSIE